MGPNQIGGYLNRQEAAERRRAAQGSQRITKREWYDRGAFANSRLWRRQSKGGAWQYFQKLED